MPDHLRAIVPLVQSWHFWPARMISHVLPLPEGARAYDTFDRREDNLLKMLISV